MSSKVSREDVALYILMTFQDEENRVKRESFEKDNIVGMEDVEFPVYMQAVEDPSSYDDHIWDDTMPINGDLNPDQQGDPLNGWFVEMNCLSIKQFHIYCQALAPEPKTKGPWAYTKI